MNERIKELSRKSFMLAHEANDLHEQEEGEELSQTEFSNVFNQKFAELIVQECALTLYKSAVRDKQAGFTHEAKVMELAGHMIKQHFGIKE